ncbi:MAG: hypothetical protein PVH30_06500 [Desulfobacterales bacterium]|jgi:hypothetical protein
MMPLDDGGIHISRRVLDFFPDIEPYLDMLDKAATLDDHELTNPLSERISEMLRMQPDFTSQTAFVRPAGCSRRPPATI